MGAVNEPIVVNTGPLIALAAAGSLDLLGQLHSPVVVPSIVLDEFRRGDRVNAPDWLDIRKPRQSLSEILKEYLDIGEASVITVAREEDIELVAIDEKRGRRVARLHGLRVTGSLGILLRAKRTGLLPALRPCIDSMLAHGIWLSDWLCTEVLREAGES